MDVPINATVACADGPGGHSVAVIMNPVTDEITHLVVEEAGFVGQQRMVPLDLISESTPTHIQLRCTRDELARMPAFMADVYMPPMMDDVLPGVGTTFWPYAMAETYMAENMPAENRHAAMPPGELTVQRGADVYATDGHVGRVDEFLVDPTTSHITHLVLRKGHLWRQKEITIPISQIDHIAEDAVYLKLNISAVAALPTLPIVRRYA